MPTTGSDYQPSAQNNQISAEFPFNSNYIEAHSSSIHYIAEGSGKPVCLSFMEILPSHIYGGT